MDLASLMALPDEHRLHFLLREYVCPQCLDSKPMPEPNGFCSWCGIRFDTPVPAAHRCQACILSGSKVPQVRFAVRYEGIARDCIHSLKYGRKLQLARPLGILLYTGFRRHYQDSPPDLIVPIPLHGKRMRQRGFNQVFLMLRHFKRYGASREAIAPTWTIDPRVLERIRNTRSQTGCDRSQRQTNIKGAFRVVKPSAVVGKHVLIVDDVVTTGATSNEAAAVLRAAGAASVSVLAFARA